MRVRRRPKWCRQIHGEVVAVGNEKWLLMVVNGIEVVEKVVVMSFMSGFVGKIDVEGVGSKMMIMV
ncbi:hypothetical protein TSUD_374290 [Trifolium subterraneum]|uniref:Uncharacterized protein n=1 Tax=Trifolium subterraneum TaxID=3900 RepID=A0A2Z6PEZ0_TRISU|nr:hypothetical protein TSUD_374290 [Trifolium subterraneum]